MGIDKTRYEKRRATRLMAIRLLTSAILGILIVATFYLYNFLTTSEMLAVAQVDFQGLNRLQPAELEKVVADVQGQNILLVPLETYAARFGNHSRIRSAEVRRILPDKIVFTIREREPVALVFSGKFMEVDKGGMIMTADPLTELLDLPIITGLDREAMREGKLCKDDNLRTALAVLQFCKNYGGEFAEDISELRIAKDGINIVSLKEGMVLLLGDSDHKERLRKFFIMKNTIARKDKSAKLIDLRFNDQIVLRSGI